MLNQDKVVEFKKKIKARFPGLKVNVRTVSFEDLGSGKKRFVTVHGDYNLDAFYQIKSWSKEAGLILQQQNVLDGGAILTHAGGGPGWSV